MCLHGPLLPAWEFSRRRERAFAIFKRKFWGPNQIIFLNYNLCECLRWGEAERGEVKRDYMSLHGFAGNREDSTREHYPWLAHRER